MPFSLTIASQWNVIQRVRDSINADEILKSQSKDFREQTMLTGIELASNALKYSDLDSPQPVRFSFEISEGECRFEVTTYSANPFTKRALLAVVDTISAGDPFELYVKRLEQLKDDPDGYSRLGLYRIAYEGEFRVTADIRDETVTVRAVRLLEKS